jgi:proteasome lid subunit RPN8/RPN11
MRPLALAPGLRRRIERHVRATRNEATDRRRCYVLAPADLAASVREARERSLDLLGYYHSHPGGRAEPSVADRAHAWPEVSYLIVALDGFGMLEARSWRLAGDGFVEEPVRWPETE